MEAKVSHYHKYKETNDRWRKANQVKINEYYKNKRAEKKAKDLEEFKKGIIEEYINKN